MGAEKAHFIGSEKKSVSIAYEFAGSKFTYKRVGNKESISTLGPIKDRLIVKVSCVMLSLIPSEIRLPEYL